MALTKASYSMITGAYVNVLDYGADPTGVADSTAAIASAIAVGARIYFPRGAYKCNITITNSSGIYLYGETQGQFNVEGARLFPADNTKPVIDIVGPVIGCVVENIILDAKFDSTSSYVGIGIRIKANSPNFVWRSAFRHLFIRGFQDGLVIDCDVNLSEVFDCDFQDIECLGISRFSFKTRGVYNRFGKLFATQCGIKLSAQPSPDYAIFHDGSNCHFDIVTSDGRHFWGGTGNYVGNAIVEAIHGPGAGVGFPVMELSGTGWNTWVKVRINGAPASKYSIGFRIAGTNQTIGDALIEGVNYPTTGFQFAGGSSGILGNASQPGAKAGVPPNWYITGNASNAINGASPKPLPYIFRAAYDGTNYIIPDGTSSVILDPTTSPLAAGTITMPQANPPQDGQVVTISTTKTITSLTFNTTGIYSFWSGATIVQTLSAGAAKSFIFRLADYKWYPN